MGTHAETTIVKSDSSCSFLVCVCIFTNIVMDLYNGPHELVSTAVVNKQTTVPLDMIQCVSLNDAPNEVFLIYTTYEDWHVAGILMMFAGYQLL